MYCTECTIITYYDDNTNNGQSLNYEAASRLKNVQFETRISQICLIISELSIIPD